MNWKVITSVAELESISWPDIVACDTETFGPIAEEGKLLGISLSSSSHSVYIPFWVYDGEWHNKQTLEIVLYLKQFFGHKKLIGHNFTYDKRWLSATGFTTTWVADTRIMWHLASAPSGPRPYGLKDAQVELLGWETRGDAELADNVAAKGGKLKNGDHYMADLEVLAKYACLDTFSTLEIYHTLTPFFDKHDYWDMLAFVMRYNELLELNTSLGVAVDTPGLQKAHQRLINARDGALKRLKKQLGPVIEELERDWADRRAAKYKRPYNQEYYRNHPEKWEKFNWNSDVHKRELFYDKLGNEVVYTTDSGKPSTNADSVKCMQGVWTETYLKYEKANTLTSNFTGPYLDSVRNNRLHPGFNICGTVSYRLSGFKPYLLNAPFDEKAILKNLLCDPGFVGVHADLAAIEPTVTAHYSEDPALIKVFRDGLGDIYLDLALELFPKDPDLRRLYNPRAPITAKVKEALSHQRKVAKVIQLAVQYTGTKHTVHKNLVKAGHQCSIWDADRYVQAYWKKFAAVDKMNKRLRELNRSQGYLRNIIGRIIQVPDPEYKDLPNRFIQSSAHDCLMLWVDKIYKMTAEQGVTVRPVLLDCHDSTSNQCPSPQVKQLKKIYEDALAAVNDELGLSVKIRAEIKTFNTLSGLKNEER